MTEATSVRIGYSYNENPIPQSLTLFNTQLPGFFQHVLGVGATQRLTEVMSASVAYVHTFENSISGSIAQIAGTNVENDLRMDSVIFSVDVKF